MRKVVVIIIAPTNRAIAPKTISMYLVTSKSSVRLLMVFFWKESAVEIVAPAFQPMPAGLGGAAVKVRNVL